MDGAKNKDKSEDFKTNWIKDDVMYMNLTSTQSIDSLAETHVMDT